MSKVSPEEMLKEAVRLAEVLEYAATHSVYVGLPKEKVGGQIYGDGMTILSVGAIHEYGAPEANIPQRSFLRAPFTQRAAELQARIALEFQAAKDGKRTAAQALDRVGIAAMNISRSAFRSRGDGQWPALQPETIRRKGVATPLVDSGTLLGSINYVVRADAT